MELKGKKVNFLGDSITEGCGASDDAHCFVQVFGYSSMTIGRSSSLPASMQNVRTSFARTEYML